MNFSFFNRSGQASKVGNHKSAGTSVAGSAFVGELVSTKFGSLKAILGMVVVCTALMTGCGGGSSSNVITVAVTPTGTTSGPLSVIVTQSLTLTATVTGSTNTNVTWACTYTTTTVDSSGNAKTSSASACKTETGNIPANSNSTTVVYTAPTAVPDPTTFPNLEITLTATAAADTKITGTTVLALDSGIVVTLTPTTATVPTSVSSTKQSQFQFSAGLTNDVQSKGVTWLISQGTIDLTNNINYPQLTTCSPTCGTISSTGLYSAPTTVPTTATLTIVATANADTTRFAIGTITIIQGGPITFNGISPTVAPQNGIFYDIYLDAPNVTSASTVTLNGASGTTKTINFASGKLKVLFPIPTSAVTNPPSTGVRLRLLQDDLAAADTFTISVADPAQTVTNGSGPFKFSVVPVRPTTVSSSPDSIVQNAQGNELDMIVNGGYFGQGGLFANATFQGTPIAHDSNVSSTARQLALLFPSDTANASQPGLYSLSVARTTAPLPAENNPSITNLAIFPNYQTTSPAVINPGQPIVTGTGGPLTNASAIDIDQQIGVAAVAVTGGNRVEFFKFAAGSVTPIGFANVNVPSGLSINHTLHTVAVVSFQDQAVSVFPIPTTPTGAIAPIATIPLAGFIPAEQTPLPLPYSIGVDSDTNRAVVAYSSPANPTTAKVGFLLDLNAGNSDCLSSPAQTATVSPCVFAQVTLNTGTVPQIAMLPHSHLAVVTPGGIGVASGVDVTKVSASSLISNVSVTSGLVTVTTTAAHGLNPGNPGTILILNVPKGATNQTDFNGAFTVQSVINSTSFTYALNVTLNDSATGVTTGTNPSTAYYSPANLTIGGISQTTQGVAVNPITGLIAAVDANATGINGPQINLLSSLDQNFTSISFQAGCTVYTTTCSGAPELLGTTAVAFQPFVNSIVSYNATQNQLSISNPVTLVRYSVQSLPSGTGTATLTPTVGGSTVNLPLTGGVAVDAATNQALVVQSGSGSMFLVNLGPTGSTALKPVQVAEVLVPSSDPNTLIGGIKGASFPQGTLTSTTDLTGVKIFGSGFGAGAVVRLDQTPIPTPAPVNDREIDVTIPASFLTVPHRFALDVVSGGVQSNASDFIVVKAIDMTPVCTNPQPSSVAVADQIKLSGYHPIALVSNSGCNSVSVIDIAAQLPVFDGNGTFTGFTPNPAFGSIPHTIAVGNGPQGVAISPRFGLAVVANNTAGTASVVNLLTNTLAVTDVTTGSGPIGVAINEGTGAALVANTGSNTVSEINLGLLFGTSPATSLAATSIAVDTEPIAIAIDPDRGGNNQGLAVVTALALNSGSFPSGVLDTVDIGTAAPAKSTTAVAGSVTATPTGVVFDASISPALFYATSSGGNVITSFNPDSGAATTVHVGINPTSLALNPQTGGILTMNTISNTISIVDSLSSPFKTRKTFGIPGSPQLGVAIDQFLNLAVIVDQANNRVLLFPMPN